MKAIAPRKRKASTRPKSAGGQRAESPLEAKLMLQIRAEQLPIPNREYRFHPVRKWRLDFCWPELKLAVEVEGGAGFGRHCSRSGFSNDLQKYSEALLLGWTVYRCGAEMIKSGQAITAIKELIERHQNNA